MFWKKRKKNKLKLDMTPWPLLVFGVSFFLARVLQVFLLSAVWTYMREQEKNPQRRDIKHRMTAAVIASETTKRIKTPLPLSPLLLPGSFFPDGIITQFATRKWNHSESSTFQWADAPPPSLASHPRAGEKTRSRISGSRGRSSPRCPLSLCLWSCRYKAARRNLRQILRPSADPKIQKKLYFFPC